MSLFSKESIVRKQIILMGGDFIVGMAILLLFARAPREIPVGIFSEIWVVLFIPVLIFSSYFCEIYNIKTWLIKTLAIRSAIVTGISFIALILVSNFSGIPWQLVSGL